jgi:hypothetical protein
MYREHGLSYHIIWSGHAVEPARTGAEKFVLGGIAAVVHKCKGIRGRGGLHCPSRDEGRQAYEASHLR